MEGTSTPGVRTLIIKVSLEAFECSLPVVVFTVLVSFVVKIRPEAKARVFVYGPFLVLLCLGAPPQSLYEFLRPYSRERKNMLRPIKERCWSPARHIAKCIAAASLPLLIITAALLDPRGGFRILFKTWEFAVLVAVFLYFVVRLIQTPSREAWMKYCLALARSPLVTRRSLECLRRISNVAVLTLIALVVLVVAFAAIFNQLPLNWKVALQPIVGVFIIGFVVVLLLVGVGAYCYLWWKWYRICCEGNGANARAQKVLRWTTSTSTAESARMSQLMS